MYRIETELENCMGRRPSSCYVRRDYSKRKFRGQRGTTKMANMTQTESGKVSLGWMIAVALVVCSLASVPAHAQSVGANLSGTITDSSGAAIVGATVSITNAATGVNTTGTTNET